MRILLITGLCLSLLSCQSQQRTGARGLDQQTAESRADRVSNVHYDLHVSLDRNSPEFQGKTTLRFQLNSTKSPLTVDFNGGTITKVEVNGTTLKEPNYNKMYLQLPATALKQGSNAVTITYSHPYSKTGAGLYRYLDPQDNRVYVYTDFEPYDANRLFPSFDQPDIKATYTLQVQAPQSWVVISSVREKSRKQVNKETRLWEFPKSAKFSTYIFSLHAGPYKMWKDKKSKVPSRLFARRTFAKYVNAEEWFTITRQGFEFFEEYFDYPYPFEKYDQVIVPDFNSGAMENVGAVTFSERYMPKGVATRSQRERRANVILHELAHMWFGNLVTMKWWDDLWLNESFATFMASLALAENTEFKEAWQTFFYSEKGWAYWEDDLVTTHPIVADVPNTEQAFVNFDGITYGKGAAALKQLSYFLGPDKFRDGTRAYFKKFAYKNTQMRDFIQSLATAANAPLGHWTEQWLKTASHNTLAAQYQCNKGKISQFNLVQGHKESFTKTRAHRTIVGLYNVKGGKVTLSSTIPVTYSKETTPVNKAVGLPCPTLVYPNHDDYDFVKIRLDPTTLKNTVKYLSAIEDPLVRMMFWDTLWGMVRDAQISTWEYANLMFTNLPKESNVKIAQQVVDNMTALLYYIPTKTQKMIKRRHLYVNRAEGYLWSSLLSSKPGSDFQKLWFDGYVRVSRTTQAYQRLVSVLKGKVRFKRFAVDQDRRWRIIRQLHQFNWKGAEALRVAELKRDPSAKGKKSALAAVVSQPDPKIKREWFDKIVSKKGDLPLAQARVAMRNIFPQEQETIARTFATEYYKNLKELANVKDDVFLSSLSRYMTPALCTQESVAQMQRFLQANDALSPVIKKRIRVHQQEDERCIRIRQRALLTATRS